MSRPFHPRHSRRFLSSPAVVLAASMCLNAIGFTLLDPVLPFLVGAGGADADVARNVGLLVSAYAACELLAAPWIGLLSDRYGRRPVLIWSLSGSAVGYLMIAYDHSLPVLLASRMIDGATAGNVSTIYACAADMTEDAGRGRMFGMLGAAGGVGFMIGPALGGLAGEIGLAVPAWLAVCATLVNLAWIVHALPDGRRMHAPAPFPRMGPLRAMGALLREIELRRLLGAAFLFGFAGVMFQTNITVLAKEAMAAGPLEIGLGLLMVGLLDLVVQGWLVAALLARRSAGVVARAGLAVNAVGMCLTGLAAQLRSRWLLLLAIPILTLGDGLFQPTVNGLMSKAASSDRQGVLQGISQIQHSGAKLLAPLCAAACFALAPGLPYAVAGALLAAAYGATRRMAGARPGPD